MLIPFLLTALSCWLPATRPVANHGSHRYCLVTPHLPRSFLEAVCPHQAMWGTPQSGLQLWRWPHKLAEKIHYRITTAATDGKELPLQVHTSPSDQTILPATASDGTPSLRIWPACSPCATLFEFHGPGTVTITLRVVLAPMHRPLPPRDALRFEQAKTSYCVTGPPDTVLVARVLQGRATWQQTNDVLQITLQPPAPDHPAVLALGGAEVRTLEPQHLPHLWQQRRRAIARQLETLPEVAVEQEPWVQKALVWSGLSLQRLLVHNPDLGWGLVSGYGPCDQSPTRPRYAWFFDEPTLAAAAYLMLGLDRPVQHAFRLLRQYQRADGKPVHEVTQSLRYWPNYFDEFRYAYMHADSGPYYIVGHWLYARATGDRAFIQSQWPSVVAAFRWCQRQLNRETNLFEIRPGQWGASEATIDVRYDSGTNGMWLAALTAMAELAEWQSDARLAAEARCELERLRPFVYRRFIAKDSSVIRWAIRRDGSVVDRPIPQVFVSGWLGAWPAVALKATLRWFDRGRYRCGWGVRTWPPDAPGYAPDSYQMGSVWPVWTAATMLVAIEHGWEAWPYEVWATASRLMFRPEANGHMPEALRGDRAELLPEAVPHQMFSQLLPVNVFFNGFLGFCPDLPRRRVRLAPRLPRHWQSVTIRRLSLGQLGQVHLSVQRAKNGWKIDLDTTNTSEPVRWQFVAPAGYPAGVWIVDGRPVHRQDQVRFATVVLTPGRHQIQWCAGE